jgi:predicted Holliday junction resolvase-like endonuclease
MDHPILVIVAILAIAVGLLVAYIRRLQRKSREIEKTIDYSKMRKWEDDD